VDAPTSSRQDPQDGLLNTLSPDTRIMPRPPTALFAKEKEANNSQLIVYFVVLAALAGAGLYFFKRGMPLRGSRGGENNLKLLETKMLGNRQFLVVAQYKDNKVLIGVGPGQIQYLCSLDNADDDLENLIQKTGHVPGHDLP
jgi:flagellar protein FliO/FliZ